VLAIADLQAPHEQLERRWKHAEEFVVGEMKIDARNRPE
jgi:hypothetical protein